MATIYNIEEYRKKKTTLNPEEQFKKSIEDLGIWKSEDERIDYYVKQAGEDFPELFNQ